MHGVLVVLVCYMRGGYRRNTGDAGYARDADDKGETQVERAHYIHFNSQFIGIKNRKFISGINWNPYQPESTLFLSLGYANS